MSEAIALSEARFGATYSIVIDCEGSSKAGIFDNIDKWAALRMGLDDKTRDASSFSALSFAMRVLDEVTTSSVRSLSIINLSIGKIKSLVINAGPVTKVEVGEISEATEFEAGGAAPGGKMKPSVIMTADGTA